MKKILALLLTVIALFAVGCTKKNDPASPPETPSATEAETEKKGLTDEEKIDFLLQNFNGDGDPFEAFTILSGDYTLTDIVSKGIPEKEMAAVNVWKDGMLYAEKTNGTKKLSIWNGGLCYMYDVGGDTPAMVGIARGEVDNSLLGGANLVSASFFAEEEEEKTSPVLKREQIVLDGDIATLTEDFLKAFGKAIDVKDAKVTVDFKTFEIKVEGKSTEEAKESDVTILIVPDGEGGVKVTSTSVYEKDEFNNGSTVLELSDFRFSETGEMIGFHMDFDSKVKELFDITKTIAERRERGDFSKENGKISVKLTAKYDLTVKNGITKDTYDYESVVFEVVPAEDDTYRLKLSVSENNTDNRSLEATIRFDTSLFPQAAYEKAKPLCLSTLAIPLGYSGAELDEGVSDGITGYIYGQASHLVKDLGNRFSSGTVYDVKEHQAAGNTGDRGLAVWTFGYTMKPKDPSSVKTDGKTELYGDYLSECLDGRQIAVVFEWEKDTCVKWTKICTTDSETIEKKYGTSEMTKRYGDAYTAAANELYKQAHDGKAWEP